MTKEQIQDRIRELEVEKELCKTNFAAAAGAIQDCNYWLQQLDTPVEVKE